MPFVCKQTFRRLLISKLQDEFENRTRNVDGKHLNLLLNSTGCFYYIYAFCGLSVTVRTLARMVLSVLYSVCLPSSVYDKRENPLLPEEEEQRAIAKIKMLGNIKFIGELGKLDLIHESILHKCIKTVSMEQLRVRQSIRMSLFGESQSIAAYLKRWLATDIVW